MKKFYDIQLTITAAKGAMSKTYIGSVAKGGIAVEGDDFDNPIDKLFQVTCWILSLINKEGQDVSKDFTTKAFGPIDWVYKSNDINLPFNNDQVEANVTVTIAKDWSMIEPIRIDGSPKGFLTKIMLKDIVMIGNGVLKTYANT